MRKPKKGKAGNGFRVCGKQWRELPPAAADPLIATRQAVGVTWHKDPASSVWYPIIPDLAPEHRELLRGAFVAPHASQDGFQGYFSGNARGFPGSFENCAVTVLANLERARRSGTAPGGAPAPTPDSAPDEYEVKVGEFTLRRIGWRHWAVAGTDIRVNGKTEVDPGLGWCVFDYPAFVRTHKVLSGPHQQWATAVAAACAVARVLAKGPLRQQADSAVAGVLDKLASRGPLPGGTCTNAPELDDVTIRLRPGDCFYCADGVIQVVRKR